MQLHHPLAYFTELVVVTAGQVVAETANLPITELIIDSRGKSITPFPIFFSIVGVNHNGHDYIEIAYQKGIRQFVVDRSWNPSIIDCLEDVNILQVDYTVEALQQFMAFYRSKHKLPLLGITGSNGKTIVKEWMHEFLSRKYKTVSNPHSYNSQVGVPLSISLLQTSHEYGVFEAGISKKSEMAKLLPIMQPTHGLFTNIGPAHSEGFASITQKIEEKLKLFTSCSTIYYCRDHELIHQTLQQLYGNNKILVSWSFYNPKADYLVTSKQLTGQTSLQIRASTTNNTFIAPFRDNASIENITHCLVYLLHNRFEPQQLQRSLLQLKAIPMRMTLKAGIDRCQIIDDTYTNDLVSLKLGLDFIEQEQPTKRTVILSDIVQSATPDHQLYQEIADLLAKHAIDRLIGIGPIISQYSTLFTIAENSFFNNVEEFIAKKPSFRDETILVKGARIFQLERVVQTIEKNNHETILEIDMQAIRHNVSYFRKQLNPTTKIMAMVKAATYGSGSSSFELASVLQRHGIEYLGVAYLDEGICLRDKGITLPIMVMNPTDYQLDKLVTYKLEPEIYSLELLDTLTYCIAESSEKIIPIHLKLETGMNRLGIAEAELDKLIERLKKTPRLEIVSIFSHLAASQTDMHDTYTHLQVEKFIKMSEYIENHLSIKPLKHLLNTNGILRFPQFQFDMVRLGIGLHGVGVDKAIQPYVIPASRLKTTISQVKAIQKGATIGYDRKAIAAHDMVIATIPIGYADGLSRSFGCGKGSVLIAGQKCAIIGNVCMDMAMIDVTNIRVKRGDEVIIFSAEHSVDLLAEQLGTISYELLTQISQRVKRIYYT